MSSSARMSAPLAPPSATTEGASRVAPPARAVPRRLLLLTSLAILLLAAALRLNQITQPYVDAFSWRQSSTAMIAENYYRTSWNIFYPEVNWTGPGPNYQGREFQTVTYLAALLYTIVGQQDWVGRAVAVAFGLWGIIALFLLVRRVWDEQRALASAALMGVLPASVFIERSFLPDPAMVALMTTSVWLFVLFLQTERRHYLWLAALFGAWGGLTKITGLIIGLPMLYAVISVLGLRRVLRPRRAAELGLFGLLVLVPVAAYYLWARHLALTYPPNHFAGAGNWVWEGGFSRWVSEGYYLDRLANEAGLYWRGLVVLFVFLGLLFTWPREPTGSAARRPRWLFHWWLVAGMIYYLLGARELVSNPWNLHILTPAVAALAAYGAVSLGHQGARLTSRWRTLVVAAPAVLLVGYVLWSGGHKLRYLYHPYSGSSHELGLTLRQLSDPGDLVVTLGDHHAEPTPIYYSRRRGWIFPPLQPGNLWLPIPEEGRVAVQLLDSLRGEGARWFGLVSHHKDRLWADEAFAAYMAEYCAQAAESPRWYACRLQPPAATVGAHAGPRLEPGT